MRRSILFVLGSIMVALLMAPSVHAQSLSLTYQDETDDGINAMPSDEAFKVMMFAFVVAMGVALILYTGGKRAKAKAEMGATGNLGPMKYFMSFTGPVAVFAGIFTLIVALYIVLKAAP